MRIGLLCDMYTPHVSGVTTAIRQHKAACEALGHEVWVVTFGGNGHIDDEPRVLRCGGLAWGSTGWNLALSYPVTARRLVGSLDVAHFHHPFSSPVAALPTCREARVPTVFTCHSRYDLYADTYARFVPRGLRNAVIRRYLHSLTARMDAVIAPSAGTAEWLRSFAGCEGARVIPGGVDVAAFSAREARGSARERLGIPADALVYCSLGRLGFEKRPERLLAAFALVAAAHPDAWLLLVGDGPARDAVERQASDGGIARRVVFAGQVAHEALPEVLSAGDVFCSASLTETQGLAALEAMAAGMPVVCVDAPGLAESVTDGVDGLLARDTVDALAAAMARVAEPGLRATLSAAALESARRHDSAQATRRVLGVYEQLAEMRA